MLDQGIKIIELPLGEVADGMFFPCADTEGTYKVSWEQLKANIFGGYSMYAHDIPGSTNEIVTFKNMSEVDAFTILELRAPGNGATLEATLSLHNYSEALGEDWVRDITMHNYSGSMLAIDVLSNFTNATRGKWHWVSKAIDGGVAVDKTCAILDGTTGYLYTKGNIDPLINDAQNLGESDMAWANAYIGYVKAAAVRVSGSFRFLDGVTTYNGVSGTFVADGHTLTIKGGIITSIV